MNDRTWCGNEDALVAFLYDEGDPAELEAIAAHVARCRECSDEIESLRLTRTQLASWSPPAAALGFRITQAPPADVLTSPKWWRQPLPAWAQMAAAVVIFAGGMALGSARTAAPIDSAEVATPAVTRTQPVATPVAAVSRADFDALRAEVLRLRDTAAPDQGGAPQRVLALVDERVRASEDRQRREFDRRTGQLVRDFQTVRAADMVNVSATVNGFQTVVGQELAQQRDAIRETNYVVRTGQAVPINTSLR